MNASSTIYIGNAFNLLKNHVRLALVPISIAFISIVIRQINIQALTICLELLIVAICAMIYGTINALIIQQASMSIHKQLLHFFFRYIGLLLLLGIFLYLPMIILFSASLRNSIVLPGVSYRLLSLYMVPLLFFGNSIRESIVLGFKCLVGNFKFNLPLVILTLAPSLLHKITVSDTVSSMDSAFNFLLWCIGLVCDFVIFTAVSLVLWDKMYAKKTQRHSLHPSLTGTRPISE